MTPVSHGKPCAGNPHARFDEGASASEEPRRNALLHTNIAQEFLDRVAGALEVPSVSPDTDFRAGPLWDSLTAFALRVMIQQRFGKTLSAAELEKCKTVADLMAAAGVEP